MWAAGPHGQRSLGRTAGPSRDTSPLEWGTSEWRPRTEVTRPAPRARVPQLTRGRAKGKRWGDGAQCAGPRRPPLCFFSRMMKGFFDAVDPDLESAAHVDGCTRRGVFLRVALPQVVPGMAALGILSWLWTWNEFLFALLLTGHGMPLFTVRPAQFVHEFGIQWNLMSATGVLAMFPGLIITVVAQRYVVEGLTLR